MMPRMGADMDRMHDGGLPKSFILAVTATDVHALEDTESSPEVVKSWDRQGFTAKTSPNHHRGPAPVGHDRPGRRSTRSGRSAHSAGCSA
jgi:hypothetical protein